MIIDLLGSLGVVLRTESHLAIAMIDPLCSLAGDDIPQVNIRFTPAGNRALLGRKKVRGKPLIQIFCCGCKRSSWDSDQWISSDYIESFAQLKMF